jgi:hypothetical protein
VCVGGPLFMNIQLSNFQKDGSVCPVAYCAEGYTTYKVISARISQNHIVCGRICRFRWPYGLRRRSAPVLCRYRPLRRADHSFRGVLLGVCVSAPDLCHLRTSTSTHPLTEMSTRIIYWGGGGGGVKAAGD